MVEKYLVINAGSSSLKFSLFEMPSEKLIANGLVERIGEEISSWKLSKNDEKFKGQLKVINHTEAFNLMIKELLSSNSIKDMNEIKGVGHRILHGKDIYNDSVIINDKVIQDIKDLTILGPLHHPGELAGIEGAKKSLKDATMTATFDTAFHQTMPKDNYLYATPYEWFENYGVRKYGFHGTSHKYITEVMQEKIGKKDINIISCHIGSGASICCIKNGKCLDTTMGFTPFAGLVMGTRSGDIDASILEYMNKVTGKSIQELMIELNKKSGLLGISGISNDYRDVESSANNNDERSIIAIKKMVKSVSDYILTYYNELEGNVDAIVFTAGIGENSSNFRRMVLNNLKIIPVELDNDMNNQIAGFKDIHEGIITSKFSKIPVFVIPTNEELMIARDSYKLNHGKEYVKSR